MYVSHNELGSALVRSQVLPYVEGLRARGIDIELVTFEPQMPERPVRSDGWWPVPRRRGAGLVAKAIDLIRGTVEVVTLGRTATFLHARSYVPAAITAVAGILIGRPFIFDMRGFLPDEYVDAGYWSRRDVRYWVLRGAERYLLRAAAEVVVLTEAAARRLRAEPRFARHVGSKPITVVPCDVDLTRFRQTDERDAVPTLLYTGSLGSFYELDAMLAVYGQARVLVPQLRFLIINRTEHDLVRSAVTRMGLGGADVVVRSADFSEMPSLVARAHVGIALLRRAPSKLGSSAIKVAEYLACGVPVIVNAGLGDADAQISAAHAGHVMAGYAADDVQLAAEAVARLIDDQAARVRARELAEREYDLRRGVERYAAIYARVAGSSTT